MERQNMKCIIGLGNPGKKYAKTRHNIGFMMLDEFATSYQESFNQHKFKCNYSTMHLNGEKELLIQPQTFMNLSGEGVRPLLDYFKIKTEDIAVVYDDMELQTGKIRLREIGGHDGHNGIRCLIDHFGIKEFTRMRIGIKRTERQMAVVDYVLQNFQEDEMPAVKDNIDRAMEAVACFIGD